MHCRRFCCRYVTPLAVDSLVSLPLLPVVPHPGSPGDPCLPLWPLRRRWCLQGWELEDRIPRWAGSYCRWIQPETQFMLCLLPLNGINADGFSLFPLAEGDFIDAEDPYKRHLLPVTCLMAFSWLRVPSGPEHTYTLEGRSWPSGSSPAPSIMLK